MADLICPNFLRRISLPVILLLVTLFLPGCKGKRSGIQAADKMKIETVHFPILLRYKWRPGQDLRYDFLRGPKDAQGHLVVPGRLSFILACKGVSPKGIQLDYRSVEEMQVDENSPREILDYRVEIDVQGVVRRLLTVPSHEILPKGALPLGSSGDPREMAGFIGNPTTDIKIGVLNCCLLPTKPVSIGSVWKAQLRAPELPASAGFRPLYVGKLLKLTQDHGRTCAVIQAALYFSGVNSPYRARVDFDILAGEVISVDWQSIPGVDALYAPLAGGQQVHLGVRQELQDR